MKKRRQKRTPAPVNSHAVYWLLTNIEESPQNDIKARQVYQAYTEYCDCNGISPAENNIIGRLIGKLFPIMKVLSEEEGKRYSGIRLIWPIPTAIQDHDYTKCLSFPIFCHTEESNIGLKLCVTREEIINGNIAEVLYEMDFDGSLSMLVNGHKIDTSKHGLATKYDWTRHSLNGLIKQAREIRLCLGYNENDLNLNALNRKKIEINKWDNVSGTDTNTFMIYPKRCDRIISPLSASSNSACEPCRHYLYSMLKKSKETISENETLENENLENENLENENLENETLENEQENETLENVHKNETLENVLPSKAKQILTEGRHPIHTATNAISTYPLSRLNREIHNVKSSSLKLDDLIIQISEYLSRLDEEVEKLLPVGFNLVDIVGNISTLFETMKAEVMRLMQSSNTLEEISLPIVPASDEPKDSNYNGILLRGFVDSDDSAAVPPLDIIHSFNMPKKEIEIENNDTYSTMKEEVMCLIQSSNTLEEMNSQIVPENDEMDDSNFKGLSFGGVHYNFPKLDIIHTLKKEIEDNDTNNTNDQAVHASFVGSSNFPSVNGVYGNKRRIFVNNITDASQICKKSKRTESLNLAKKRTEIKIIESDGNNETVLSQSNNSRDDGLRLSDIERSIMKDSRSPTLAKEVPVSCKLNCCECGKEISVKNLRHHMKHLHSGTTRKMRQE